MTEESHDWALVLAAGDGTRLRSLTTVGSGISVPKQFCSLYGGPSLLHEALRRARAVVPDQRTCVVVAEQHRTWWAGALRSLPAENVIVQAKNRGTGLGILLSLLHILTRDPKARIILLPSDQYVSQESVLTAAIKHALTRLEWRARETILLGVRPEERDPDLGYIVPGQNDGGGAHCVARFVEKPSLIVANELIQAGGLWNAFIIVSTGAALLDLFCNRFPEIVGVLSAAIRSDKNKNSACTGVDEIYGSLPVVDFSRDILAEQLATLRVLPVPACGWSDLGTPERVAGALRRASRLETPADVQEGFAYLSLAHQYERLSYAG